MTKRFLILGIFFVVLAGTIFSPLVSYGQNTDGECTPAQVAAGGITRRPGDFVDGRLTVSTYCQVAGSAPDQGVLTETAKQAMQIAGDGLFKPLFLPIGHFLLGVSSIILITTGWIFDGIVSMTILNVAEYIGTGSEMGGAISMAWGTLRDVANMFFIFVLIFAALKSMFDLDFGNANKTIRNVIIVALLINFSLFFSKVVIDASNVVALGFYKAISQANTASFQASGQLNTGIGGTANFEGISGGYMRLLGLQTFYGASILNGLNVQSVIVVSVMGSIFMLVASVIFLISGVMFVARFVILIFLMILSPLAFIAIAIPGGSQIFDKWKSALIDQSFFAPLFFALTWVSFKLGSALITKMPTGDTTWVDIFVSNPAKQKGIVVILLNYVLVIGFSIAALVFAKQMASRTAGFTQISGAIGSGAVGGAAFIGRQTIGRGANMISENKREAWSKTTLGRAGLWMADKGRSASFNVGGLADTKLGKMTGANKILDPNIIGKTTGVGGFAKATEEKAKKKAEYAKRVYGQTSDENEALRRMELAYKGGFDENGEPIKGLENELSEMKRQEEEVIKKSRKENVELAQKAEEEAQTKVEENRRALEKAKTSMMPEQIKVAKMKLEESERDLELNKIKHKEAIQKQTSKIEDDEFSEELKTLEREANEAKINIEKQKNLGKVRQLEYAKRLEKTPLVAEGLGAASGIYGGAALGALFGPLGILIGGAAGAATGAHLAGKLGSGGVAWAGNKSASRSVRALAEGKEKKDKKKLQEDLAKALGIEEDKKEDQQQN